MPKRAAKHSLMGHVRNADPELWLELRLEATRRRVPTGTLFNEILRDWLERRAVASQSAPAPKGAHKPAA